MSQSSLEKQTSRVCVYVFNIITITCACDLLWGIGSCGYGGWEVPRFVVGKVETQESQQRSSSPSLRPKKSWCFILSLKAEKSWAPLQRESGRRNSLLCVWGEGSHPFCSSQAFSSLDETQSCWGGWSALLSFSIQTLNSSENTLTDTSRIMFDQISGYCVAQSGWHPIRLTITNSLSWGI